MARKPEARGARPSAPAEQSELRLQARPSTAAPAEADQAPAGDKPDWTRRWAMIRAVLGFCAGLSLWITLFGPDDRLRETALLGLLALGGAVALGYLGFATQDDRNWLAALGAGLGQRAAQGRGR